MNEMEEKLKVSSIYCLTVSPLQAGAWSGLCGGPVFVFLQHDILLPVTSAVEGEVRWTRV